MIKVLIVDDEYFAREGMKNTIPWKSLGCEVVGEADNGIQGVQLAKEKQVDIVITDINMSGLNGIDMAKEIRKELVNCKFIIITGFDEFKYAKQAVTLKAIDFLLKPVDDDEFLTAIKNAVKEIQNLNQQKALTKEIILQNIIKGKIDDRITIKNYFKEFTIVPQDTTTMVIEYDNYNKLIEDNGKQWIYEKNKEVKSIATKFFKINFIFLEVHAYRVALVFKGELYMENFKEQVEMFKTRILKDSKVSVSIGLSRPLNLMDLREAYCQGKEIILNRRYDNYIGFYGENDQNGIEKAIKYIKNNYCKEISLGEVAKYSYVSESYLSRKIKQEIGVGFSEYVNKLRIQKSKELLKDSNITIQEVAIKVGYSNYRYFTSTFKKHTGYKPSEYVKLTELF